MCSEVVRVEGRFERLIARSAPAQACIAQLQDVAADARALVLVGEPGVGRSTLATHFLELAKWGTRVCSIDGRSPSAGERLRALVHQFDRNAQKTVLVDHLTEELVGDANDLVGRALGDHCRVLLIADERDEVPIPTDVPQVRVPPLRERRSDVAQLARQFARRSCEALGHRRVGISGAAMNALEAYRWPENVRELADVIDRAVSLRDDLERIEVEDLPRRLCPDPAGDDEDLSLEAAKRRHVLRVFTLHRRNLSASAKRLGVSRNTVARWIHDWEDGPQT